MRVLIIGAGAVGGYLGGSLALAGNDVVFLDREPTVQNLRAGGLRLNLPDGERHVPRPIVEASPAEALKHGPFEAAVFAVKSYHTQGALLGISPHAEKLPAVICTQNGVENEDKLAAVFGPEKVIAASVTSAVSRSDTGTIILERRRGIGLASGHPDSSRLSAALRAAGLNVRLYPNAQEMKWSKLLTNLIANATSAILDMPPGQIFAHPGLFRLEIGQLREALEVMRALGLSVVNLPGTPVRLLALAAETLPGWLAHPLLRRAVGSGRGGKMPSFHIDLFAGKGKSEVGDLNGAVVRFGESLGVPTPINRLLTSTLLQLISGELAPDTYTERPDRLLEKLNRAI